MRDTLSRRRHNYYHSEEWSDMSYHGMTWIKSGDQSVCSTLIYIYIHIHIYYCHLLFYWQKKRIDIVRCLTQRTCIILSHEVWTCCTLRTHLMWWLSFVLLIGLIWHMNNKSKWKLIVSIDIIALKDACIWRLLHENQFPYNTISWYRLFVLPITRI